MLMMKGGLFESSWGLKWPPSSHLQITLLQLRKSSSNTSKNISRLE